MLAIEANSYMVFGLGAHVNDVEPVFLTDDTMVVVRKLKDQDEVRSTLNDVCFKGLSQRLQG